MQRLEVSSALRPLYGLLGFKGLIRGWVGPIADLDDLERRKKFILNAAKIHNWDSYT